MFAKLKAALASFAIWIAHRIKPMDIEAELAAGVQATEDALKAAAGEAEKVIEKIEAAIEPAKTGGIPVFVAVGSPTAAAATSAAPGAVSTTDTILSKVKDLLSIAERDVSSFDAFAALAKKSVTGDADAVLAKLRAVMVYGKASAVDVFDEVVAAVKVL